MAKPQPKAEKDPKKLITISAYAQQGEKNGTYKGADLWQTTTLPVGTRLAQLDYDTDRINDTRTAGQFFTTEEELQRHTDPNNGKVNTASLSESVQVMAQDRDGKGGYQHYPNVTVYEVVKPMPIAVAKVTDNPAFGKGGADQFYSPIDQRDLIEQERDGIDKNGKPITETVGFIKPVKVLEASTNLPRHEIYDLINDAAAKGVAKPEQTVIDSQIKKFRNELIASNHKSVFDKLAGMDERVEFSNKARDLVQQPIDWEAVKGAALPEPRTPEEKFEFALSATRNPERRAKLETLIKQVQNDRVPEKLRPAVSNDIQSRNNTAQSAQNERTERTQSSRDKDFGIGDD